MLDDIGLDGNIAQYNEMSGLSGGQKVKVVIAAALWNNPQVSREISIVQGSFYGMIFTITGPSIGYVVSASADVSPALNTYVIAIRR